MFKVKFHDLTPQQVLPALWNAADQEDSHVRALRNKFQPRLGRTLDAQGFSDLCFYGSFDGMFYELLLDVLGLDRDNFRLTGQNGNFVEKKFDLSGYDRKFGAGKGKAKEIINRLLRENGQ